MQFRMVAHRQGVFAFFHGQARCRTHVAEAAVIAVLAWLVMVLFLCILRTGMVPVTGMMVSG